MIEDEVRTMLARRAADVNPAPDAWWAVQARLVDENGGTDGEGVGGDRTVVPLRPREGRRPARLLVAAALAAVVGLVAVVATRPDGDQRVRTVPADGTTTTPTPPPPSPAVDPPALWPATTPEGLAGFQAEADAGRRPDLLDPRAAAGQYLSDRFLAAAGAPARFDEVQEFRAGDATSGEVPYRAGGLPGTVLVRRAGGEGSIWYVVALTHLRLPVEEPAYDGHRLRFVVRPTAAGRLVVTQAENGRPGRELRRGDVTAGQAVEVEETIDGPDRLVVQLSLTGADGILSLAEFGVDRAAAAGVPPVCAVLADLRGERPPSYVGSAAHRADLARLAAAAPPELVDDVGTFRRHVEQAVTPDDPATQDVAGWPGPVTRAVQRIQAYEASRCLGTMRPGG